MPASIRSYNGVGDIAAIRTGARKSLYPLLRKQAGFVSYSLIDAGGGSLTSVSVFNTRKQAEAANSAVPSWLGGSSRNSYQIRRRLWSAKWCGVSKIGDTGKNVCALF